MALVEAALAYAVQGWPVFPLRPRDKRPATRDGFKAATVDAERIARWWSAEPECNIGAPTGVAFDVLDVDSGAALDTLDAAAYATDPDEHPVLDPGGPLSRTGHGWHFLWLPTGRGNTVRVGGIEGVDWRGAGGYVVLPPSVHPNGRRYEWMHGPGEPLQPMPAWLAELLRSPAPAPTPVVPIEARLGPSSRWSAHGLVGTVAVAAEGERNATLHWAACRVADDVRVGRATPDEADAALGALAIAAGRAGLDDREVARTIASALRGAA